MGGGFYDLNIRVERQNSNYMKTLIDTLKTAYKLGYDTVAVNTILEADALQGKKEKANPIPPPLSIPLNAIIDEKTCRQKFTVLQRLTVTINDPAQTHKLQTSQEVKHYDMLAVLPENDKSFQLCCSTLDIDIITFYNSTKLPLFLKHQQVGMALDRGIFFEINYATSLGDRIARRHTISNARSIISVCKRKNVIVSSQALQPMDLRGPYDVINLCALFGLKAAQSRDAVTMCARRAVLKAECRKSGKGVFTVAPTSSLPVEDLWKVNHCKNGIIKPTCKKEEEAAPSGPKSKKMRTS